ncbi:hypothetical protein LINGRAHAP2_LOCUS24735 [Linum grandiflorum]
MEVVVVVVILTLVLGGGRLVLATTASTSPFIQSEDGDMIECIDIQKQPAFEHPALRNHTIQMAPSNAPAIMSSHQHLIAAGQLWTRSGSCPQGTIPRRIMTTRQEAVEMDRVRDDQNSSFNQLTMNRSRAIMLTGGYSYSGVKGNIRVWNPHVEDDDYSISHVSLVSGGIHDFETIRSGWSVNPKLYGDTQTRLFVYWTVDGSKKTGCFDLNCPGFVQTSSEIALGSAIYPISNHSISLPYEIIIYISKDPVTGNWWVEYGENVYLGYWPRGLFNLLGAGNAQSAEWGGEVYSTQLGKAPHTTTGMGSGGFPDYIFGGSGWVKKIRVRENSVALKFPDWVNIFSDEFNCYDTYLVMDYIPDPEFYYGGPGRNPMCR